MKKIRTIDRKLALAVLVLVGLLSVFFIALAVQSTQLYQQEIQQKLNRTLAEHIADDIPLLAAGTANQEALSELFHTLMIVNPSIELYVVDVQGRILAFNAPPGKVRAQSIDLRPVAEFMEGSAPLPIRGTDPRAPDRLKVFSAAPMLENGRLTGYLYIVLGGEDYDGVVDMIRDSYILRLLFWIGFAAFLVSLFAGVLSFTWLTTRIRRMIAGIESFNVSGFETPITLSGWNRGPARDEIDEMGLGMERLSHLIVEQIQQLRESDANRRELIANISHDLRTPLTSMQGYLETLQIKKGELSAEEFDRYVELTVKHSKRLSQLISDLFELTMLESPGSKARIENFSLAELVQDVVRKFELKTEQKHLRVSCKIPEYSPYVEGDIAMIERVLENLIENAIKFSPEGKSISVSVAADQDSLEVRIADTGIGIEAEELPKVFERFYRADRSRSDKVESNGLGLAIARRILQLHDSEIGVQSMPGEGSCFFFRLPIAS